MLNVKTEHFFGSQERYDLQLVKMTLDTTDLNEKEAVENGWLIANDEWYQCRSTRIDLRDYFDVVKRPKTPDEVQFVFLWASQLDDEVKDHIQRVYDEFVAKKGFDPQFNIFSDFDKTAWIIVMDGGDTVAFTKMIYYQNAAESQFTAWNYHKPKLSLGKAIIWYEAISANTMLCRDDYLYLGQGYENGSIYKADLPGFEWWTGSEWSRDAAEYKRLCARDSEINSLEDLSKVYNNGYRQEPTT
jgi:hypothetical protein